MASNPRALRSGAAEGHAHHSTGTSSKSTGPGSSAQRPRHGRSAPRSRNGCVTCKQRRVRCDEVHPICGHCDRLQLTCGYKPQQRRWLAHSRRSPEPDSPAVDPPTSPSRLGLATAPDQSQQWMLQSRDDPVSSKPANPLDAFDLSGQLALSPPGVLPFSTFRTGDAPATLEELHASWAGEYLGLFPDETLSWASDPARGFRNPQSPLTTYNDDRNAGAECGLATVSPDSTVPSTATLSRALGGPQGSVMLRDRRDTQSTAVGDQVRERLAFLNQRAASLLQSFEKIIQPPAAILIGGYKRWRRLRSYLVNLSEQSQVVHTALLCLLELLMIDDTSRQPGQSREECLSRALEWHSMARDEISAKLSKRGGIKPKSREPLLAAIFLLSWVEVIRDQQDDNDIFPRDHAERIITSDVTWNSYSQQLLSWLNTLDSKASHLGGQQLLSPRALQVVSRFPAQIASSQECFAGDGCRDKPDSPQTDSSPHSSEHSMLEQNSPVEVAHNDGQLVTMTVQVKQVMLNTILQPALDWYSASQAYCRRIGAHDKHHRSRFTSQDEYEVITACKQLEEDLLRLWSGRPAVVSLTAEQLSSAVAPDVATRLEEVFSVYLASYWILFVYLHRISWWHLPHSSLARLALARVWQSLQQAYGEILDGGRKKVVHPALLWPVFLFGSESDDKSQQEWAVEQLEALGSEKPVLRDEDLDQDSLPPFKMSAGATRNARRAARLLTELIKEQKKANCRVDDRDLSLKLFGCYFSIV